MQTQLPQRDQAIQQAELIYLNEHKRLISKAEGIFLEWAQRNASERVIDAGEIELLRQMRGLFDNPENMHQLFGTIGGQINGTVEQAFRIVVPNAPIGEDTNSRRLLESFVSNNSLLINRVGDILIKRLRMALLQKTVRTFAQLHEEWRNASKVTERNVEFWARDQTLRLHSDLTRTKHQSIGIERYFWTDSNDERVRHRHRELGELSDLGQAFEYRNPPIVDSYGRRMNPGEDYNCRCTAFPILD